MSKSLQPHGLLHARLPCPSPSPRVYSNSCPLSRWCHPTISSSASPFSFCLQFFPESGSFPMSWLFALGDQSISGSASASVLPMNILVLRTPWTVWRGFGGFKESNPIVSSLLSAARSAFHLKDFPSNASPWLMVPSRGEELPLTPRSPKKGPWDLICQHHKRENLP